MVSQSNSNKVHFFIDDTNNAIAKTAAKFCRTQAIDEIRMKWSKIRLGIKRFARDQRRKAVKKKDRARKNKKIAHINNEKMNGKKRDKNEPAHLV